MAGQVGFKSEAVWGTPVVVDKFVPVLSANMSIDEGYLRSAGIRAGRRTRSLARLGAKTVGATVVLELYNTEVATLLKHVLGNVETSGAGPYTHVFTPGPHVGKSLTTQVGIEDTAGVVQPFTLAGSKVDSATISCSVGELAQMSLDLTARDYTTATALAAASYAAGLVPFTFIEGAVSVDGTPVASARSVTLTINKGLKTDRHALGSRLIREQVEQEHFEVTTEITADFDNLTLFDLMASGAAVTSSLTFDNSTESLTIATRGQVVGDPPSLTGIGIEEQTIRLDHASDTSDADTITATLVNGEASAA